MCSFPPLIPRPSPLSPASRRAHRRGSSSASHAYCTACEAANVTPSSGAGAGRVNAAPPPSPWYRSWLAQDRTTLPRVDANGQSQAWGEAVMIRESIETCPLKGVSLDTAASPHRVNVAVPDGPDNRGRATPRSARGGVTQERGGASAARSDRGEDFSSHGEGTGKGPRVARVDDVKHGVAHGKGSGSDERGYIGDAGEITQLHEATAPISHDCPHHESSHSHHNKVPEELVAHRVDIDDLA